MALLTAIFLLCVTVYCTSGIPYYSSVSTQSGGWGHGNDQPGWPAPQNENKAIINGGGEELPIFNFNEPVRSSSFPSVISFTGQSNEGSRRGEKKFPQACRRIVSGIVVFTTFTPALDTIKGHVLFKVAPHSGALQVTFDLQGLPPNSEFGCHVHQWGNLTNICDGTGVHFNPHNVTHGAPSLEDRPRHVGDIIGNVTTDEDGMVDLTYVLPMETHSGQVETPSLCGDNSIIGRTLVIHENPDDGGIGNAPTSTTTGNSGPRIACGIVGIGNDEISSLSHK